MKTTKYSILGVALLMAAGLAGCQDSYDAPELQNPQATFTPNTTIAEFKNLFKDELAVKIPYLDETGKMPYVIHGRVISSDASGNIYKSLVIQDETGALAFSVNQGSMYTDYRLGQEIVVNATDLWFGQYNEYLQFGWLGEYSGNPQITFMAYDIFNAHAEKNGFPNQDFVNVRLGQQAPSGSPYCIITTLAELKGIAAYSDDYYSVMGQLVEIPNVSFADAGQNPPVTFSIYQEDADRYIKDAAGNELNVRCSGYSSFYNEPLPVGTGTVRGILSRYGDSWQLLLRDMGDVMFDSKGTKSEPLTVEEAIAMNNNLRAAWVQGYVVGSVKASVENATADDIILGAADTELDNNIVIAPDPDCTDFSKMLVVELPAGSRIRQYANLLDNEDVLGKKMDIYGELNEYLGMHGLTNIRQDFTCFQIYGVYIPGSEYGSGTEEDPYTPEYIIQNPGQISGIWVEGYIVGFVEGNQITSGAVYTIDDIASRNYVGNNFILGATLETTSLNECIPVTLANDATYGQFRAEYGLKNNPDKFHKHVAIKADVDANVYGTYGIKKIYAIKELQ